MAGASVAAARRRFEGIEASLRARPGRPAIKVGLASLAPDDMASDLIDRADAALRWSTRSSQTAYECFSTQLDDDPHIT